MTRRGTSPHTPPIHLRSLKSRIPLWKWTFILLLPENIFPKMWQVERSSDWSIRVRFRFYLLNIDFFFLLYPKSLSEMTEISHLILFVRSIFLSNITFSFDFSHRHFPGQLLRDESRSLDSYGVKEMSVIHVHISNVPYKVEVNWFFVFFFIELWFYTMSNEWAINKSGTEKKKKKPPINLSRH